MSDHSSSRAPASSPRPLSQSPEKFPFRENFNGPPAGLRVAGRAVFSTGGFAVKKKKQERRFRGKFDRGGGEFQEILSNGCYDFVTREKYSGYLTIFDLFGRLMCLEQHNALERAKGKIKLFNSGLL